MEEETSPGLSVLQDHGFGMCLKWMTPKKNSHYHGGGRRVTELSQQGLWPVATSCHHFLWSLLKDTGRSDIRHQPSAVRSIPYSWELEEDSVQRVVQDCEIQTDIGLNSDFDTLGSLPSYFISQRFNFALFCFEVVILTPTSLSCVKFKWDDTCKTSSTVHSI